MSNLPEQGMGSAQNAASMLGENVKGGAQNVKESTQQTAEQGQQQLGSKPQSDSTKKSHATNPDESAVPKKLQEKLPGSVEKVIPHAIHPTGPK